MMAAVDVVNRLNELKINCLHIKLRGRGGKNTFTFIFIFFFTCFL